MARTCTLKGNPFSLEGPQLKAGDQAPDATLKKTLLDSVSVSGMSDSLRVLSVVPSLDTPVCAEQTKRFYKHAANFSNVRFCTISCDLPVAMTRFCGAENIDTEKMTVLSDHKDTSFGKAYGTLIPQLRILCRAVFIVDKENNIRYAEYVPEVGEHPNYDAVISALMQLT